MKYFVTMFAVIALAFGFAACGEDEEKDTAVVEDTADAGASDADSGTPEDPGSDTGDAGSEDTGAAGDGGDSDDTGEAGSDAE